MLRSSFVAVGPRGPARIREGDAHESKSESSSSESTAPSRRRSSPAWSSWCGASRRASAWSPSATDAQITRVAHRAARLRAARGPGLRGLGRPVRERLRGRAAPQGAARGAARPGEGQARAPSRRGRRSSRRYAEKVEGENVVKVKSHREEIALLTQNIEDFKRAQRPRPHRDGEPRVDRVVTSRSRRVHKTLAAFEAGARQEQPGDHAGDALLLRRREARHPVLQLHAEPDEHPGAAELAQKHQTPFAGMDGKTGQTLLKTALAAMFRVRQLHIDGLVLDQLPRQQRRPDPGRARARTRRR